VNIVFRLQTDKGFTVMVVQKQKEHCNVKLYTSKSWV